MFHPQNERHNHSIEIASTFFEDGKVQPLGSSLIMLHMSYCTNVVTVPPIKCIYEFNY
jgi:hypothetical protein